MSETPIVIPPEQIQSLYNFAKTKAQVNWPARYRPNPEFLQQLIPNIHLFLDRNIRKVTYDPHNLRAVVGISGGLDSSVSATLTAEMMAQAQNQGTAQDCSLVLIAFRGMSEPDFEAASRFAQTLSSRYRHLAIDYQARDLTSLLRQTEQSTEELVASTNKPKVYSGELTSRLMTAILLEFGDKTGHAVLDSTNGTEYILGEIVIGAGAECAPLADLYKSQVYDLAELLQLPQFIIDRPPINSTWGHDKVATYFRETPIGLTARDAYQVLDPVLYYLYERKYQPSTVAKRLGHDLEFVQNLANRLQSQDHRRDIPYFAVTDRTKKYRRAITQFSNDRMTEFITNSLAING